MDVSSQWFSSWVPSSSSCRPQWVVAFGGWALVNVAFLVVVCWLTAGRGPWWMGPTMTAGYSVVWFLLAHHLVPIIMDDRPAVAATNIRTSDPSQEENTDAKNVHEPKKPTNNPNPQLEGSWKNLVFYGVLVTLGLAVVGWLLARQTIHCPLDRYHATYYSSENGYYDPVYNYGNTNNNNGDRNYDGYGNDIISTTYTEWTTDLSQLPVNVQEWAATSSPLDDFFSMVWSRSSSSGSLIYLPGSRTTIFTEWNASSQDFTQTLWTVSPAAPEPVALYKGYRGLDFVRVHDQQACFVTRRQTDEDADDNFLPVIIGDNNTVACTDGITVTMTATASFPPPPTTNPILWSRSPYEGHRTGPRNLYVDASTGLVWYMDCFLDSLNRPGPPKPLIYSLDPTTMVETLHSELREVVGGADVPTLHLENFATSHRFGDCERQTKAFSPIFLAIIITSLPVAVASLYLWRQQQQQGSAAGSSSLSQHLLTVLVTLLAGMSALTLVLGYAVSPRNDPYGDKEAFISGWTMCVSGAVALFCALLMMMDRNDDDKNHNNKSNSKNKILRWGRNIGAWFYFRCGITAMLTPIYSDHLTRSALPWIVFNAVVVAPLAVVGLATQSFFVLLVAAAGVLLDAHNLSHNWTAQVHRHSPRPVKVLITVVVMGGTVVVVTSALVYWWLRHRHPNILAFLGAQWEAHCAPWFWHCRHTATFTAVPSQDGDKNNGDVGVKVDCQSSPPATVAAAVAEETAAAAARGRETLAGLLRQWADRLDRMCPTHPLESVATA